MALADDQSDSTLVDAARAGDRAAFGLLLERHRPLALALCTRMLHDPLSAEDAVQEAALQALLGLASLRAPARFGAWLAGIALNVARRHLQRRTRDSWSIEALTGGRLLPEPVEWRPGPEEYAEAAELARRVRAALAGLPRGQRAAVQLHYLAGLRQAEIAAALGIRPGAVKGRLHAARGTLRGQLEPLWREYTVTSDRQQYREVTLADVRRRPASEDRPALYAAILRTQESDGQVIIWMGQFEGQSLAVQLKGRQYRRPLTYSFAAALVAGLGGRVEEVRITRIEGDAFFAEAVVSGPAGRKVVDARPSDALNLALATSARITVHVALLNAPWAGAAGSASSQQAQTSEGIDAIVAELDHVQRWPGHAP